MNGYAQARIYHKSHSLLLAFALTSVKLWDAEPGLCHRTKERVSSF